MNFFLIRTYSKLELWLNLWLLISKLSFLHKFQGHITLKFMDNWAQKNCALHIYTSCRCHLLWFHFNKKKTSIVSCRAHSFIESTNHKERSECCIMVSHTSCIRGRARVWMKAEGRSRHRPSQGAWISAESAAPEPGCPEITFNYKIKNLRKRESPSDA